MEPKLAWQQLAASYSCSPGLAEELWLEIEGLYTSGNRHYHTLQHVAYLLQLVNRYEAHIGQPGLLRLAVIYHNSIYSSTRHDNEEKSAAMAAKQLKLIGLPLQAIETVQQLILATKLHQPQPNPDANLFIDFDLAILGEAWDHYLCYSQQVRKEYSIYPEATYSRGRLKVLRNLLAQQHIYKTELMRERLEDKARENLRRECKMLEKALL